jgi:hypothetical protein
MTPTGSAGSMPPSPAASREYTAREEVNDPQLQALLKG